MLLLAYGKLYKRNVTHIHLVYLKLKTWPQRFISTRTCLPYRDNIVDSKLYVAAALSSEHNGPQGRFYAREQGSSFRPWFQNSKQLSHYLSQQAAAPSAKVAVLLMFHLPKGMMLVLCYVGDEPDRDAVQDSTVTAPPLSRKGWENVVLWMSLKF